MNLEFYRNYVKVVECGTLSAAARELHVAQSALSTQLKQFENEYGAVLFERSSRKMKLTDAGNILYDKALNIIALVDSSYDEINACANGARGTLRVGLTQAYPDEHMVSLLLDFHRKNPNIRFEIFELNSDEVQELVRLGVIEIGIIRTSAVLPAYLEKHLSIKQRICVYGNRSNPWLNPDGRSIPVNSLDGVPVTMCRGFSELLKDVFARAEIEPDILSVSTSRSNAKMWAAAGEAVAIISSSEAEGENSSSTFCLPLSSENPEIDEEFSTMRAFTTMKGKSISAAARKFIEFSREYISEH